MKPDPMLAALRETAATFGWTDSALVVDTTAERLAGPDADDDALEAVRARLWRAWVRHIEIAGA